MRTFNITNMGQMIICSYKIPESFSGEYITEISGDTSDSKNKTLSLNLEVETNLPVIAEKTVMSADKYIVNTQLNIRSNNEIN
jgi:hypothetical protein